MGKGAIWYVPEKAVAGVFAAETKRPIRVKGGFVTCRLEDGRWVSPSVFKRLTGYMPSEQRDAAAELRKTAEGAAVELDNSPVSGFEVVSWEENPYQYATSDYKITGDVVVSDPRGFAVAVSTASFFETLKAAGKGMDGMRLKGEFVYAWRRDGADRSVRLLPVPSREYDEAVRWAAEKKAEIAGKRAAEKFVKAKDLVPGRVYMGVAGLKGPHMYLGVIDTYSRSCHVDAVRNGKYDVKEFAEKEKNQSRQKWIKEVPTSVGKHVFYDMNDGTETPYAVRSSVDRMFSEEVPLPKAVLYSDKSVTATYETVMADVRTSPVFNRIDLSSVGEEAMDFGCFELALEGWELTRGRIKPLRPDGRARSAYPFGEISPAAFKTLDGRWVRVKETSYYGESHAPREHNWEVVDLAGGGRVARLGWRTVFGGVAEYRNTRVDRLFEIVRPAVRVMRFENGEPVRQEHAMHFYPEDIERKAYQA